MSGFRFADYYDGSIRHFVHGIYSKIPIFRNETNSSSDIPRICVQTYSLCSPINGAGERILYYLLQAYDPEFLDLFKVAADFDDQIDRTPENSRQFARLLATLAAHDHLRPMDKSATGRLLEECARHAGDAEKISAQSRHAADIMRESDYYAGRNGQEVISAGDVQHAIDARIRRASRIRDRLQEEILRATILIDTEGGKIGQVNALAVAQLGEFAFAHPSRITSRVSQGSGEVVDIERETAPDGESRSGN